MEDFLMGPARMRFCEASVDHFVRHPADTWTNIGPVVAGLIVAWRSRHALLKFLGWSAVGMGLASAYFHASDTLLGEALDLHGMFLFLLAAGNLQKASHGHAIDSRSAILTSGIYATVLATAFLFYPWLGTPAFALVALTIIAREWRASRIDRRWAGLFATFAVAWLFWWLDYLHILCHPGNHLLTGHGAWHLLNGLVVWQVSGIFANLDERG